MQKINRETGYALLHYQPELLQQCNLYGSECFEGRYEDLCETLDRLKNYMAVVHLQVTRITRADSELGVTLEELGYGLNELDRIIAQYRYTSDTIIIENVLDDETDDEIDVNMSELFNLIERLKLFMSQNITA